MIIAISRTILLHHVLPNLPPPSPDVSPPLRSFHNHPHHHLFHHHHHLHLLLHHRQQHRRLDGVRHWEAPSDKHFSTSTTIHLRPNWPLLLPLLLRRQIGEISDRRKQGKMHRMDSVWLLRPLSITIVIILPPSPPSPPHPSPSPPSPPPHPSPPHPSPNQSFAGLSITIGLICPRCKSSAPEGGR